MDTIDWALIETHLPDMIRVALSSKAGKIRPSTILRKLGAYSRKNKLYQAFQELGRVIRTHFLLHYLGDADLRSTIQSATNKSETFHGLATWAFFGGEGVITYHRRIEQRTCMKFTHVVATCLIFDNVSAISEGEISFIGKGSNWKSKQSVRCRLPSVSTSLAWDTSNPI